MKREICVPEMPASQMALTIITDEQLEAFANAVITKNQQCIAHRGYLVLSMVGEKHLYRKANVMRILNGGRK